MHPLAEAPNPVLPIWQEVVLGLIAFGVLYFVLWKFVFPRMEQTFRARVDAIEGGIKRAEAAQAEANQLLEQYKAQLAEARTEAARIRDEMQRQAQEERDRIIATGQEQLNQQRATLVRELRAEMGELAIDLASRVVGEALADEARRRGTVERFLNELEAAH